MPWAPFAAVPVSECAQVSACWPQELGPPFPSVPPVTPDAQTTLILAEAAQGNKLGVSEPGDPDLSLARLAPFVPLYLFCLITGRGRWRCLARTQSLWSCEPARRLGLTYLPDLCFQFI